MSSMISFPSMEQLNNYTNKINRFEKGEIAYLTDTSEFLTFDGEQWQKANVSNEGKGLTFNLYDLNKTIFQQLPTVDTKKIDNIINTINNYNNEINSNYYMLLCKDISYYTLFTQDILAEFKSLGEAVITCAQDVGNIISADFIEENNAIEIWVRNNAEEVYCMYLFDCRQMIVTYGG